METTFKKLAIQFTTYILLITIATFVIDLLLPSLNITVNWPWILLFMYIVSLGILYLLSKSIKQRLAKFVNAYLLISFSKMIIFVIIMFVYAWQNYDDAISFILTFLVYYLLLLFYEVVVLLRIRELKKD